MQFNINAKLTVSCWTVVEAETLEQAMKIARERSVADFQISGSYSDDEFWHFDNDGTPYELTSE